MLRMRLTRTGAKKRPSYRVVVADSRAPRDGRHVDIVGFYDPMTTPTTVRIDIERAVQWLRNGAQPSERVRVLLRHAGVLKAHEEARLADKRKRKEEAEDSPVEQLAREARRRAKAAAPAVKRAARTVAAAAEAVVEAVAEAASDAAEAVGGAKRGARSGRSAKKAE